MQANLLQNGPVNWTIIVTIATVIVVTYYLLKRSGQISHKDALAHLRDGAVVVDLRSRSEYNSGHLPTAINIPLDEIETALPLRVDDKNQVLLLHCQSGIRSGIAKQELKAMGYVNVFNLGSIARARDILASAGLT